MCAEGRSPMQCWGLLISLFMEQQTLSADSETTTDPVSSPHQQRVCLCACVCVRARVKELVCASLPSPYMMRCSIRVHRWLPLAPVTYCMQAALHSRDRRGSALLELLLTKFLFYFNFWLFFFFCWLTRNVFQKRQIFTSRFRIQPN